MPDVTARDTWSTPTYPRMVARSHLETADGRLLEYTDSQGGERGTLVFHAGTPDGLVPFAPFAARASAHGLRVVSVARPGYESSTRRAGRAVADVVTDVEVVLNHVGVGAYVAVGYSGGGPHALACRALSGQRCYGAVVVSSLAPCGVDGLDFLDGMGEDNALGFRKAMEGPTALQPYLEALAPAYAEVHASEVVEALSSVLPEADRAHLSGELAGFVAEALRRGVAAGIGGWLDDTLAFTRPWGFDVHDLDRVAVWHGAEDLMVPYEHGRWLAQAMPEAEAHLLAHEGHLSLLAGKVSAVVAAASRYAHTDDRAR